MIDITGTSLEKFYGHIFGQLRHRHGRWSLEPIDDLQLVPVKVRLALEAASFDLYAVVLPSAPREMSLV